MSLHSNMHARAHAYVMTSILFVNEGRSSLRWSRGQRHWDGLHIRVSAWMELCKAERVVVLRVEAMTHIYYYALTREKSACLFFKSTMS